MPPPFLVSPMRQATMLYAAIKKGSKIRNVSIFQTIFWNGETLLYIVREKCLFLAIVSISVLDIILKKQDRRKKLHTNGDNRTK